MTSNQFNKILNGIDDNLILQAEKAVITPMKKRNKHIFSFGLIAASIVLVAALILLDLVPQGGSHSFDAGPVASSTNQQETPQQSQSATQSVQGHPSKLPTAAPTANPTRDLYPTDSTQAPIAGATQGLTPGRPTAKPTIWPEPPISATQAAPSTTMAPNKPNDAPPMPSYTQGNGEGYTQITENPFIEVNKTPTSYFSIDANTASYPNLRSLINKGYSIPKDAVRIEEMLNYFSYDYQTPNDSLLALNASLFDTPYNRNTKLLTIGLATKEVQFDSVKNNLVFLIDVSGSMMSDDKLPLVQQAFSMLAKNLNPEDRVSIVTYASGDKVALDGAYGYETKKIIGVIEDLFASGSTAGSRGIQTAYEIASKYFIKDGNNRVILATDGDFNVGITSTSELETFISQKRQSGIYFSVFGVGRGNIQSSIMETLALNGNGTYSYIDSVDEAKRALVDQIGGSMVTVAKDVKASITFDPKYVSSYRLIGYENKSLTQEEFEDTNTDAGELGSGHTVTLVYELELTDNALSNLDYLAHVAVRYKSVQGEEQPELKMGITGGAYHENLTDTDKFVSAVVEFGLLLRDSQYKQDASFSSLIQRIDGVNFNDELKQEFVALVKKYVQNIK